MTRPEERCSLHFDFCETIMNEDVADSDLDWYSDECCPRTMSIALRFSYHENGFQKDMIIRDETEKYDEQSDEQKALIVALEDSLLAKMKLEALGVVGAEQWRQATEHIDMYRWENMHWY